MGGVPRWHGVRTGSGRGPEEKGGRAGLRRGSSLVGRVCTVVVVRAAGRRGHTSKRGREEPRRLGYDPSVTRLHSRGFSFCM